MSYHLIFDIAERQIGEIRTITNSFVDYQSDQASKTCVERVTRVKKTLFAVKKQENKITEGLRTFQKCVLEKKNNNFYFSGKVTQSRYKYYFYTWNFLMVESGKNIFQSYFLETWRS